MFYSFIWGRRANIPVSIIATVNFVATQYISADVSDCDGIQVHDKTNESGVTLNECKWKRKRQNSLRCIHKQNKQTKDLLR